MDNVHKTEQNISSPPEYHFHNSLKIIILHSLENAENSPRMKISAWILINEREIWEIPNMYMVYLLCEHSKLR